MDLAPDAPRAGASLDADGRQVTFRVEPDSACTPLRVWYHLRGQGPDPEFRAEGDQWVTRIPRPPVARMEYLLVLRWADGGHAMVPDPANPRRVRGVFGEKSVIEFPGYSPPWWLSTADGAALPTDGDTGSASTGSDGDSDTDTGSGEPGGTSRPPAVHGEPVDPSNPAAGAGAAMVVGDLVSHGGPPQPFAAGAAEPTHGLSALVAGGDDRARRWPVPIGPRGGALIAGATADPADVTDAAAQVSVAGQLLVPQDSSPDEALPLVVVHDGPEYAEFCQLTRYLEVLAGLDPRLRCRALLLAPRDRDRSYSASPAYARALATGMIPQVTQSVATRGPLVGIGSSLGGLAMLHVAARHPGTFGAVFSQSGSFFQPGTDDMERGFRYFGRITRFIDDVNADPGQLAGVRLTLTCGTGEDNLANNRALTRRLVRGGVAAQFQENPDGHNHVGWRDCLDPGLRGLLSQVWADSPG